MNSDYKDKNQGWKNSIKIIFPYFFVVGICQMIGYYISGLSINFESNVEKTTKQLCIIMLFDLAGTIGVIWIFRKYIDKKSFTSLGFRKGFIFKDVYIGLLVGFIIMLTGFTCLIVLNKIQFTNIKMHPDEFMLSIGFFLLVAISEEVLLRGYILNNLIASFNKYTAIIISSVIFSLLHAANPNFDFLSMFSLFIAGIFFGLAYVYTNNLWLPIALHFSWNFFQGTIFGFNVSGKDTYSLITIKYNIANIWNGGGFGFEGSILSVVFQLIVIVIIYVILKNRNKNSVKN